MLTGHRTRVAVLCSGRAPGLLHLLTCQQTRAVDWKVVCCVTSERAFDVESQVAACGIPILRHSVTAFYETYAPHKRLGDLTVRTMFDAETVRLLRRYRPELIVLAGYLLLVTRPMLEAYPQRIINVHHSDLSLRNASGRPRYPGLRAVRDAILAGESETRSTAHLVTDELDGGPILLRSRAYRVPEIARWALAAGEDDVLRKVVWAHQEWMLRSAFGPLLEQALELVRVPQGV